MKYADFYHYINDNILYPVQKDSNMLFVFDEDEQREENNISDKNSINSFFSLINLVDELVNFSEFLSLNKGNDINKVTY